MTDQYAYNTTKRLFELYKELTGIDLLATEKQKQEVYKK